MSKHQTIEQLMGDFTEERIKRIGDQYARETLSHLFTMTKALGSAFLSGNAKDLESVGLSVDDVEGLASDGLHFLGELEDRDRKEAAAAAATAAVQATHHEIHDHLSGITLLLRGKLGPKSGDLKKFGVKPLATGGRRKKTEQPAPPKPV